MAVRHKRTDLSLRLKVEIIQLVQEKKLSQQEIATRFGCSQSAVSKIVKTKETVMREAEENMVSTRKRKRRGKAGDVEAALYKWFVDARARDAPVTSAVLEEKANHLAALLGNRDLKPRMAGCAGGNRATESSSRRRTEKRRMPSLTPLKYV